MPHYKDLNNQLHWLDSDDSKYLLPEGCTKITAQEAETIRISAVVPPSYQQLRASEYCPVGEMLDALTKLNSGIAAVIAGGQAQLDMIVAHNLAVKAKYPKS